MRQIGRQALFFASMVVISLLLYYPTPPDLRWVCVFTASLAGFWALAFGLQYLTSPSEPRRRRVLPAERAEGLEAGPESPFGPPPPPGAGSG